MSTYKKNKILIPTKTTLIRTYLIKVLEVTFFSFFIALSTNVSIKAQDNPPCLMDCPDSPWIYGYLEPYQINPDNCPNCWVSISYWYRENACTLYNDIQLDQISFSSACLDCGYTTDEIVQFAKDMMIRNNVLPKPDTNQCDTNWRAFSASCWGQWTEGDSVVTKPCLPAECCWDMLQLCRLPDGTITYRSIIKYAPLVEDCYKWPYPCEYTCYDPPEYKINIEDLEGDFYQENAARMTIYPNPIKESINLKFYSNSKGNHFLQIFNLSGNLIFSSTFDKTQDEFVLQMNINQFSTGTYFYIVKYNGEEILNGSFIISK